MFQYLRKIRKRLFLKNPRTGSSRIEHLSKYIVYALGEIILVVIGILFALGVNNWNTKNKEQSEIKSYYVKIEQEVALTKARIEALNSKLDYNYSINIRSLAILSQNNRDSLYLLESTLGTLGANPTTNLSVPIIEEFFEKGLLSKVENDSIKVLLQSFKIMSKSLNSYDAYLDAQYVNSIEPYFYEHINYSQVTGSRRRYLLSGGPKTDFQQFYDNLELWNLITFKIESIEVHQDRLKSFLQVLEKLNQELAKV